MRRAGFSATTRQGIKNTSSPAGNVGERARRRPSQRGFRSGLSAPSTRGSPAAASSVAPIARAPSSPRTGISLKGNPAPPAAHHRPAAGSSGSSRQNAPRRILGHHPPRDKEHHLASRKCRRESTPQTQSTRLSIRAVGAVDPVAPQRPHRRRSDRPSSIVAPNRNITKKEIGDGAAIGASAGRVEQIEMRRAGFSATTRQGIKNTISPAGNVGERARRRPSQRGFRSGLSAPSTPWLHSGRIVGRSDRPSSIVAPNRNITKNGNPAPPATHHRPEQVEQLRSRSQNAPRRILGHHPPRDKEHHLASRKCRRESTPQTQSTRLSIRAGKPVISVMWTDTLSMIT